MTGFTLTTNRSARQALNRSVAEIARQTEPRLAAGKWTGRRPARQGEGVVRRRLRQTVPQEDAKTAHFCSMRITEDVRRYAAEQAIAEEQALAHSMTGKAKEFTEAGAEVYKSA